MYTKVVLDALVENPDQTSVSRMIVVINSNSLYRDYADFHKHDPKWWEDLAAKVYETSPYPKMALAPYLIAAGQYLLDKDLDVEDKVVPLVSKAMAIDEDSSGVQTLAKICMALKMGAVERPSLKEMRKKVLPRLLEQVAELETKLEAAAKG